MRLIDADALKKHYAWWDDDRQKLFDSIVDSQPTVDAVPVIRCRDCRWWRADKESCMEWYDSPYAEANGYCSRAERKEE